MAFELPTQTKFGVDVKYWVLISVQYFIITGESEIVMAGYIDQPSKDAGHEPLLTKQYKFGKGENPFSLDNNPQNLDIVTATYLKLKSLDEWKTVTPIKDRAEPQSVVDKVVTP